MNNKRIIIAIDGHSSCGKSTFAKAIAARLGYIFIDTGAMYRAVTLYAMRKGISTPDSLDEKALIAIIDWAFVFVSAMLFLHAVELARDRKGSGFL